MNSLFNSCQHERVAMHRTQKNKAITRKAKYMTEAYNNTLSSAYGVKILEFTCHENGDPRR